MIYMTNLAGHPSNKACLEFLGTHEVAAPITTLYGPAATAKLTMARAGWLRAVGQVPDQWKQTLPFTAAPVVAAPVDKAANAKPGAAGATAPAETVCLEQAANLLQVGQLLTGRTSKSNCACQLHQTHNLMGLQNVQLLTA